MANENTIYILIVDENEVSRHAVKEGLTKKLAVARVIDVSSHHDAMARFEKQKFDLVITNFQVPGAETTLLDEIARLPQEKKPYGVIVGFDRITEIPKLGKSYFLAKPIDTNQILAVINETMAGAPKVASVAPAAEAVATETAPSGAAAAQAAAVAAAKKSLPIDVNFINPFMEGAVVVIETVCETKSERESVFTRREDSIRGDISAVIAMNSSNKQGSFAISFEKKCFLALAGRMLGETYTEINEENKDVVGEICNQIFGYAKRKLNNEMGHDIQPAIPSIITGDDHQIKHLVKGIVIAAKFKTPEGWYTVEAAVSN